MSDHFNLKEKGYSDLISPRLNALHPKLKEVMYKCCETPDYKLAQIVGIVSSVAPLIVADLMKQYKKSIREMISLAVTEIKLDDSAAVSYNDYIDAVKRVLLAHGVDNVDDEIRSMWGDVDGTIKEKESDD